MTGPSPGVRWSGLGLALLGFLITRLLVAESMQLEAGVFVVAGLLPMATGLGLSLFGVAIAIGAVTPDYARTVWTWAVIGTVSMVVVLAVTALHAIVVGGELGLFRESGPLVANMLLGGAILGTIVGDRSARHRRTNEELIQYAERSMLVNRLLRHEVLNAVSIVNGHLSDEESGIEDSVAAIRQSTEQIQRTIQQVGSFAGTTGEVRSVDLAASIDSVREQLPSDANVQFVGDVPEPTLVRADERLELLLMELLENAIEHTSPETPVRLTASVDPRTVTVTIRDDGPGLPDPAVAALAERSLPEFDDPSYGYGLQMVRLLVEHYGGSIGATAENGTAITVQLHRTSEHTTAPLALGVPRGDVYRVAAVALVAGLAMGLVMEGLAGTIPVIGTLYGVDSQIVGWVTHFFHSLVFGLLFAAGCTLPYGRSLTQSARGTVGLAVGWALALWIVAAGVIMPVWLLAANLSTTIPNLTLAWLLGHLVWGLTLGAGYWAVPEPTVVRQRLLERLPVLGE